MVIDLTNNSNLDCTRLICGYLRSRKFTDGKIVLWGPKGVRVRLACFLCIMAYQISWFILCQCHHCRRTVEVLFNPQLGGIKEFIPFSKGISLKVNVILRLGFELSNYDVTIQHFSHYITVFSTDET